MSLSDYQINFMNKILSIPSVGGEAAPGCPYGEIPRKVLQDFLTEAESNGFKTGVIDDKVGYIEIGNGDKLLGIVCHLDVVPAGDGWNSDAFTPTYKDGKLFARGIVDDKGPALISYFAMKDILDNNLPINSRIRLILGTDEERTCDCVETYAAKGEVPDFSFTPDAEFPVVFAEKGILQVKVSGNGISGINVEGGSAANMVPSSAKATINGNSYSMLGKTAHGSKPYLGINAIEKLVSHITNKEDISGSSLLSFVNKYIINKDSSDITGCSLIDDSGNITTNVGIIEINENTQSLIIDIRYPVTANKEEIIDVLSNKAAEFGLSLSVEGFMAPLYKDKDSNEISILTSIWKKHMANYDGYMDGYDKNPEYTCPVAMGGGTYARHLPNTIAFGIQAPWAEDQCHQANEYMSISDIEASIELIKEAILELGN